MDKEICVEETDEQENLESGRLYKISNNVSKQVFKEEWEELYNHYIQVIDEMKIDKDDFFIIAKRLLKNKKYRTKELDNFNKKIIREFLNELKKEIEGKIENMVKNYIKQLKKKE